MDIKAARRVANGPHGVVFKAYPGRRPGSGNWGSTTCAFWIAGKCNRNPCRFAHTVPYSQSSDRSRNHKPISKNLHSSVGSGGKITKKNNVERAITTETNGFEKEVVKKNRVEITTETNAVEKEVVKKNQVEKEIIAEKKEVKICEYWVVGNCVYGDNCRYLHSWTHGEGFTRLTQLEGHKKPVSGITLPSGSDKLYSSSRDGTIRVWDCNTGQCTNIISLGGEVGSLINEGQWIFVGMPNVVRAWNSQTSGDYRLNGPVGQVYALAIGKDVLFAGAEDGAILAWKACSETNSFKLAATLTGHTKAVVSLVVGGDHLYSGSMDHRIRVWDIDALKCIHTLDGHNAVVTSLLCWDQFLLSGSLDKTIKVWVATEDGNLEVTYTHTEVHGILSLSGMNDAEEKPILFCSCNDNSVHLYQLPSFSERGRFFARREVREIQIGPGGLFFAGDASGNLGVWKLLGEPRGSDSV